MSDKEKEQQAEQEQPQSLFRYYKDEKAVANELLSLVRLALVDMTFHLTVEQFQFFKDCIEDLGAVGYNWDALYNRAKLVTSKDSAVKCLMGIALDILDFYTGNE